MYQCLKLMNCLNCCIVQIGTVVEGSADFYTSRIPKCQRKSNLIDELLSDAEFRRYVGFLK